MMRARRAAPSGAHQKPRLMGVAFWDGQAVWLYFFGHDPFGVGWPPNRWTEMPLSYACLLKGCELGAKRA